MSKYPVYGSMHARRHQNVIAVAGDSRKSETANVSTKSTSDDLTNVPVDEVRLSGAVRKIMASANGVVSLQAAAHLALKVASSDPALARQAFGRIMSAVTFNLLSHADSANAVTEKHTQDVQVQNADNEPPNLANNNQPAATPATDISPLLGGNIGTNEESDSVIVPLR